MTGVETGLITHPQPAVVFNSKIGLINPDITAESFTEFFHITTLYRTFTSIIASLEYALLSMKPEFWFSPFIEVIATIRLVTCIYRLLVEQALLRNVDMMPLVCIFIIYCDLLLPCGLSFFIFPAFVHISFQDANLSCPHYKSDNDYT